MKPEIHIPPEVLHVVVRRRFVANAINTGWAAEDAEDACTIALKNGGLAHRIEEANGDLTAALQAWPGMHEKNIKGSLYYDGDHSIVLPIIRTEEPRNDG
jgi:hypothetical protein